MYCRATVIGLPLALDGILRMGRWQRKIALELAV